MTMRGRYTGYLLFKSDLYSSVSINIGFYYYSIKSDQMEKTFLELTTKIPKEKLVYTVCEFYWEMGHREIKLFWNEDDSLTSLNYEPLKRFKKLDELSNISVHINKKTNRELFFDNVNVSIEKEVFKTRLLWDVDLRFRKWHLVFIVYLIVAFVFSLYSAWNICPVDLPLRRYCFALSSSFIFVVLFLPLYYLFKHLFKKLKSHPSTIKYAKDFEEFIRNKEKEW